MRIVRLKIDDKVSKALDLAAKRMNIEANGLIQDVYSLVRRGGNNLPTDPSIIPLMAKAEAATSKVSEGLLTLLMRRRLVMLKDLRSTGAFREAVAATDPIQGTALLLYTMKLLYFKRQSSSCSTCSLLSSCAFGAKYSTHKDSIHVYDPDYKSLVNPACPKMPDIESTNQIVDSINTINDMASPDGAAALMVAESTAPRENPASQLQVESAVEAEEEADRMAVFEDERLNADNSLMKEESDFDIVNNQSGTTEGLFKGFQGEPRFGIDSKFVGDLSAQQMAVFELGQQLDSLLQSHKKGHFKPSDHLADKSEIENIKSASDLPKVLPSENALPDDVFDIKATKRSLAKRQHFEKKKKRAGLYVCIDVSGSMSSILSVPALKYPFARSTMAACFTLALLKRLRREEGIFFARTFDDSCSDLQSATDDASYDATAKWFGTLSWCGGGTNISGALDKASQDITRASGLLSKVEVLLITDGTAYVDCAKVAKDFQNIPISVLDVSGNKPSPSHFSFADHFFAMDRKTKDLSGLLSIIATSKPKKGN